MGNANLLQFPLVSGGKLASEGVSQLWQVKWGEGDKLLPEMGQAPLGRADKQLLGKLGSNPFGKHGKPHSLDLEANI